RNIGEGGGAVSVVSSFVTLLREGFEVTLLVAIVLAYLVKIERREDIRQVWYGVGAALLVSLAVGAILFATAGGLEGTAEYIFEGTAMWVAVGFLTYMILWMRRESRNVARSIRQGIDSAVERGGSLALVSLVFVMVLREGIETALFVFGITRTSEPLQVALGGALGIAGAVVLGYAVYAGGKRINLGTFFKVTGVFLILVAAGLLAHGVAEFEEAGLLPAIMPVWDVSGSPVLGEGTIVSDFLTAFFGWNPEASLVELLAWFTYIVVVGYAFLRPQPLPEGAAASPAARNN
ncbi:MAG TPA: FTR1 family protein, partial [Rubrobacter sp.]|nr:FTR1 family protein [Rubrobacter sp.]